MAGKGLGPGLAGPPETIAVVEFEWFCPVMGYFGDLCRATSGEGETEPKQIGEGTHDWTEGRDSREHGDISESRH